MRDTIIILGIPIDNVCMDETIEQIFAMFDEYEQDQRPRYIATVNVDFVVNTLSWRQKRTRHPELSYILRCADLVTPDGMPIVWASKLLGTPLKERVAGADLVPRLAEEAAQCQKSVFFLGGQEEVAQKCVSVLKGYFPALKVAGIYSPRVHVEGSALANMEEEDRLILEQIHRSKPDILFVGFGNPKQELWFERNRNLLKVPVTIGVGGTFAFVAGSVARAPVWMQKTGFEWIFRLTQDPKRLWKRYFIGFCKFGLMAWPAIIYYHYKRFLFRLKQNKYTEEGNQNNISAQFAGNYIQVMPLPQRLDAGILERVKKEADQSLLKAFTIVLDFQRVNFIDSSGLGFLISVWRKTKREGKGLYLMGINPTIRRFFELNRTWDLFFPLVYGDLKQIRSHLLETKDVPPFYFIIESNPAYFLLSLFGRLDALQMKTIDIASLFKCIGQMNCIMNLKGLHFVDSSGLVLFLKMQNFLASLGKAYLLCELNDTVLQVFRIAKLNRLFHFAPDLVSAKKQVEKIA